MLSLVSICFNSRKSRLSKIAFQFFFAVNFHTVYDSRPLFIGFVFAVRFIDDHENAALYDATPAVLYGIGVYFLRFFNRHFRIVESRNCRLRVSF